MTCITEFKLSPAVVLYNRMHLMRQDYCISFHDLDPSDISEMIELICNMIDRKEDLGFYTMVLGVLNASKDISLRYNSYRSNLARAAKHVALYGWHLNYAVVLDHCQSINICLHEHRNPYRALQVAYYIAYITALQT